MKRTTSFSRAKILFVFDKIPFFREFNAPEREKIVDHAFFYIAEEGEQVIEQDSLDNSFYILMSGEASVQLNGIKDPVAQLNPGQFFGELSFLLNTPRSSNVVANKLCILLRVDRQLLGKLHAEIREKFKDQIILKLANMVLEHNG